jgi:hypothetical protein
MTCDRGSEIAQHASIYKKPFNGIVICPKSSNFGGLVSSVIGCSEDCATKFILTNLDKAQGSKLVEYMSSFDSFADTEGAAGYTQEVNQLWSASKVGYNMPEVMKNLT